MKYDARAMIHQAAEFDRRQRGIVGASVRQARALVAERERQARRIRRYPLLSLFEVQQPGGGGGGGASGRPVYDTTGVVNTDQIAALQYKTLVGEILGGRQYSWAKARTSMTVAADYDCASNVGQQASPSASNGFSVGASEGYLRISALSAGGAGFLLTMPAGISNYEAERLPYLACLIESVGTANNRNWVGMFSTNPGTSDDPAGFLAGFRYSDGVNGNRWSACTKNNGTISAVDTGVNYFPSVPVKFLLEIIFRSTALVEFRINGSVVSSTTAEIPSAGMDEPPGCYLNGKGGAQVAVVDVNHLFVSQN